MACPSSSSRFPNSNWASSTCIFLVVSELLLLMQILHQLSSWLAQVLLPVFLIVIGLLPPASSFLLLVLSSHLIQFQFYAWPFQLLVSAGYLFLFCLPVRQ